MTNMKKSSGKGKLTTIIAAVLVFALAISGVLLYVMYETVLKPADFVYNEVATGDGTGYYRNYYNGLNEDEKKIYSVILDNIGNMPESIEIPALGSGNLDNILQALSFDNPDMFFVGLKCSVYTKGLKNYFTVDYTMTKEVYEQQLKEAKDIAGVIIANTDRYTSVYEKELYVHDYLINHCTFTMHDFVVRKRQHKVIAIEIMHAKC